MLKLQSKKQKKVKDTGKANPTDGPKYNNRAI